MVGNNDKMNAGNGASPPTEAKVNAKVGEENQLGSKDEWIAVAGKKVVPLSRATLAHDDKEKDQTKHNNDGYEGDDDKELDLTNTIYPATKGITQEWIDDPESNPNHKIVPGVINIESSSSDHGDLSSTSGTTNEGNESSRTGKTSKSGHSLKSSRHSWTKMKNEEVIFSYFYALAQGKSKTNGAFDVWRARNPKLCPNMTAVSLGNMRRLILKKFTSKKVAEIMWKANAAAAKGPGGASNLRNSMVNKEKKTQIPVQYEGWKSRARNETDNSSVSTTLKNNLTQNDNTVVDNKMVVIDTTTSKTHSTSEDMKKIETKFAQQTLQVEGVEKMDCGDDGGVDNNL